MKFKNISIKWQFIFIITLVAAPLILLSIYTSGEEKKIATEQAKDLTLSIARNIAMQQKNTEASTRQLLFLISQLPEMQDNEPNRDVLNHLFKKILVENPSFAVILAALPNGEVYASAVPFKPFSIADRKYYKDVTRTKSFAIGGFAKSRLTNKPVLHYASPVLNENGDIKLILIASFDLQQYHNTLSVSPLPAKSDFSFYDYTGRELYHSEKPHKNLGKRGSPEIQGALIANSPDGSYIAEGFNNQKRLFGFVRINIEKDSPYMYVVVGTPLNEAFKRANTIFYRNLFLILIAVIIGIVTSWYYSQNIIFKRIDKLVLTANRLKDGDLNTRTQMDYTIGETGLLAQAFDQMAAGLANREKERDTAIEKLKELKERFEIAVNSAKIGIWEWDLALQRVIWDQQMYNLYELEPSDFKGTLPDWMKRLYPDDAARFEEELHHSIRFGKNHKTSFSIKTPKKEYRNIRCYYNVISDSNRKAIRIIGVNWDITERILLESELTKSKELTEEKMKACKSEIEQFSITLNQSLVDILNESQNISVNCASEEVISYRNKIIQFGNDLMEQLEEIPVLSGKKK